MNRSQRRSTGEVEIFRVREGRLARRRDLLAAEEPLEIRLHHAGEEAGRSVAVTMRTPGQDFALAAGFLFTEGIIRSREDIVRITYCTDDAQEYNVVSVYLRPGVVFDPHRLMRHFYATSSCGVCGKASLEALEVRGCAPLPDGPVVAEEVLNRLPEILRRAQSLFEKTGGLHAAALFDPAGRLQALSEDVGRHNAVDKVIGERLLAGNFPLTDRVLLVSGRASFEIMQKALVGRIAVVAAVSAPSTLAVEVARTFNMTLVGFVRGSGFNVYAGRERVHLTVPVSLERSN